MHHDPTRRYATVDALVRDVDHYLAGEPLEARPDSVRYRIGKFVRRNRQTVAATTALLVLIVSLVVYYTVSLTRARNEALAESARAQRIQRFTLNLFDGGDKVAGPAESLRVVTLLDRGLQEARGLGAEPAVEADLDVTLGSIYQQLGNFARADSLLTAALEIRRRLFGPNNPDVASSLIALSALRDEQAKFEDAERLARDGLQIARRTFAGRSSRDCEGDGRIGERPASSRSVRQGDSSARRSSEALFEGRHHSRTRRQLERVGRCSVLRRPLRRF